MKVKKIIQDLKNEQEVELLDNKGGTILHHLWQISKEEDLKIVINKCEEKGLINKPNSLDQTALMVALAMLGVSKIDPILAKLLIEKTDIKSKDFQNNFAIHYAHYCKDKCTLELLIKKSSEAKLLNLKDSTGCTPLMKAFVNNNFLLANLLLEQEDLDITIKSAGGNTIFHYLYGINDKGIFEKLFERVNIKKVIDVKNFYNQTPLNLAIDAYNYDLIKFLIENGCDVKESCKNTEAAYYYLSKIASGEVQKMLRNKLEEAGVIDKQKLVFKEDFNLKIKLALKENKKIDISLSKDKSTIHIKAGEGTEELFERLTEQVNLGGANFDNVDEN